MRRSCLISGDAMIPQEIMAKVYDLADKTIYAGWRETMTTKRRFDEDKLWEAIDNSIEGYGSGVGKFLDSEILRNRKEAKLEVLEKAIEVWRKNYLEPNFEALKKSIEEEG